MNYVLIASGIAGTVTVEWSSEPSSVFFVRYENANGARNESMSLDIKTWVANPGQESIKLRKFVEGSGFSIRSADTCSAFVDGFCYGSWRSAHTA